MTNYELLNDQKLHYISYLGKQIKILDGRLNEYFTSDRDIKLELLIGDDLPGVKEEIDTHLNKLKEDFNSLDLYDIDVTKAEKLAEDFNKIHNYFEYVVERLEKIESERNNV